MRRDVGLLLVTLLVAPWAGARDPSGAGPSTRSGNSAQVMAPARDLEMSWWSVDSGGGEASGGPFDLSAAIAQTDAELLTSCDLVLAGGLWSEAVDLGRIFCDGFENGDLAMWSLPEGDG